MQRFAEAAVLYCLCIISETVMISNTVHVQHMSAAKRWVRRAFEIVCERRVGKLDTPWDKTTFVKRLHFTVWSSPPI